MKIDVAVPSRSQLGEGAVWDIEDQALWWVDIKAGLIHRTRESGDTDTFDFGEPVGCLSRRAGRDGLIVAAKSGFYLFDPDTGTRDALHDPEADLPDNRFNDGATDPRGRFWAGSMKDGGDPEAAGQFYRVDPDGAVSPHLQKMYTTNGSCFSPDGRTLYVSDSNPRVRTIWAHDYDLDTGTPSNQRVFFDTRQVAGRPDGGTVDADGCYWQAGIEGWQLYRISPQGDLLMTLDLPIEKPTKPMFGGRNLDILYVTSLSLGLSQDRPQPEAGSLFAITGLGLQGVPQPRFGG